ncbi:MAG: alpha/beta hydrolase [Pseudomonadota bacterium]
MRITDWNDAYANRDYIPDADGFITAWERDAMAFRARMRDLGRSEEDIAYGPDTRNRMDLFQPKGAAEGLVVFVHGGYWRAFDKSTWSHFAEGPLAQGWAVATPSYTLAPHARIAEITREVAAAITLAAGRVAGPIRLVGHSAGGHLVCRMVCADTPLAADVSARIARTTSISGVHDLRPLLATDMNADFRLDEAAAIAESPALCRPRDGARVLVWVGAEERPEFVRQTTLLANIWTGLGAEMAQTKEPGRHHFDVIDGLRDTGSPLIAAVLA